MKKNFIFLLLLTVLATANLWAAESKKIDQIDQIDQEKLLAHFEEVSKNILGVPKSLRKIIPSGEWACMAEQTAIVIHNKNDNELYVFDLAKAVEKKYYFYRLPPDKGEELWIEHDIRNIIGKEEPQEWGQINDTLRYLLNFESYQNLLIAIQEWKKNKKVQN